MPPRLHLFGRAMLALALLSVCGGHWAVLQTLAWSRMLVDNSRAGELGAAVVKTFDGLHPCSWCQEIKRERGAEKKSAAEVEVVKLVLFFQPATRYVEAPRASWEQVAMDESREARGKSPRARPPRGEAA